MGSVVRPTSLPIPGPDPLVATAVVEFPEFTAVRARAPFRATIEQARAALTAMPRFHETVPLIREGKIRPTADDRWDCLLRGRLGVWHIGVPIELKFTLVRNSDDEYEMGDYHGGTFRRLYFKHNLAMTAPNAGWLESVYFFDLEGFALLRHISVFKHHPWLADELQMIAASMMVRGVAKLAERQP